MKKKFPFHLLSVLILYLLSFSIVSPFYEHPIGDDWAYSKVAQDFYETGQLKILPWYPNALILQIFWACLFLLPKGFSFSALHLSNTIMGIFALFFFDLLMKSLHLGAKERLWGSLLLVISPPFIFLSRTFHTDLSFLALYMAAAWAYTEGLSRRSGRWFWAGSLFLGLSVLVRQVGIFLSLVLLIVCYRDRKFTSSQRLSCFIPFLVLGGVSLWQHRFFGGTPPLMLNEAADALQLDKVLSSLLRIPFVMILYFGYILSPILIPCAVGFFNRKKGRLPLSLFFLLAWIIFGISVLSLGLGKGLWMPDYLPRGFYLKGAGLFPYLWVTGCGLTGGAFFAAFYYHPLIRRLNPKGLLWILSLLLCAILVLMLPAVRSRLLAFGSFLLPFVYGFFSKKITLFQTLENWQDRLPLFYQNILLNLLWIFLSGFSLFLTLPFFVKRWKETVPLGRMERAEKVLHAASFLYLCFLLFFPVATDRYFLPVFPSAILLALRIGRLIPHRRMLSVFLILCVLVLSLLHTDRVIQRVGALWEGGSRLMRQGVPPEKIDAGFVFNGWHLYEERVKEGFPGIPKGWREEGWWVTDPEYRVTTEPGKGYAVFGQIPYRDRFTPGPDRVFLTRRKTPP